MERRVKHRPKELSAGGHVIGVHPVEIDLEDQIYGYEA